MICVSVLITVNMRITLACDGLWDAANYSLNFSVSFSQWFKFYFKSEHAIGRLTFWSVLKPLTTNFPILHKNFANKFLLFSFSFNFPFRDPITLIPTEAVNASSGCLKLVPKYLPSNEKFVSLNQMQSAIPLPGWTFMLDWAQSPKSYVNNDDHSQHLRLH